MKRDKLSQVIIKGFRSFKDLDIELRDLNVLIGANGSGKSNFVGFFVMIQQLLEQNLQRYVAKQGGPDPLMYFGRKVTDKIVGKMFFGNNGYNFDLEPTKDNRLIFGEENFWWNMKGDHWIGAGHEESKANSSEAKSTKIYDYVVPAMKQWRVYHFHDTSDTAKVKLLHGINDNEYLRPDASNLAAFLFRLKKNHTQEYSKIVKTIRLVAPYFGDFHLRANVDNSKQIELEWTEIGQDVPFSGHALSDGTLRFICLTTVLLQPEKFKPALILIDEPELGLHPFAINLLASLVKSAAKTRQMIISTQSVELLDEFDIDDILVADRSEDGSTLSRPDKADLKDWLDEYSVGELWCKNLLGGRPLK